MTTTTDHRKAAQDHVQELIDLLATQPARADRDRLIEECTALVRAIGAFHMEGIRFRMFNVDRTLSKGGIAVPDAAVRAFAEARRHLEAAGFQTRSHQAPSTSTGQP